MLMTLAAMDSYVKDKSETAHLTGTVWYAQQKEYGIQPKGSSNQ